MTRRPHAGMKQAGSGSGRPIAGEVDREPMTLAEYERELGKLQRELVKLQEWVVHEGLRVCVLFEGRDAAGKGGTIKRIVERTNPRVVRVVALAKPTERERTQWYFQRYVAELPSAGEIVLFDRSWYNRAGVEHVMGFCSEDEYDEFFRTTPAFEAMLLRSGIILVKYWFSVSTDEQERRFQERASAIRANAGSSARWTYSHAPAGWTIREPRTACSS